MQNKKIIIFTLLFFVLQNTSYFIENLSRVFDLLLSLILVVGFLVLSMVLLVQVYKLVTEKFANKPRIFSTLLLCVVLTLSFIFPAGLINYENLQGEDLLIAYIEGVANGGTTLKIKKNNKFIQTSVWLGVERWHGTCNMVNDTIKFTYADTTNLNYKFTYGVIKLSHNKANNYLGQLLLYKNYHDTKGLPFAITQYHP